eukprot:280829-Chlamydomonas_euryale.AAC.9
MYIVRARAPARCACRSRGNEYRVRSHTSEVLIRELKQCMKCALAHQSGPHRPVSSPLGCRGRRRSLAPAREWVRVHAHTPLPTPCTA